MLTADRFTSIFKALDASPWNAATGRAGKRQIGVRRGVATQLYTPDERRRRDATPWTLVQGILAPVQFLVFLVSLGLVLNYLATGEGYVAATASIIAKTCILYLIMVTGCIWEKVVWPLAFCAGLLLGRCLQHVGAGTAHGLSGGAAAWHW